MGEARARRRAHAAILEKSPWCIYCGGETPANTIDHMPPIQMFLARQRPKGLEFPACNDCNQGTRHADLVAALMGRMYPDAKGESAQQEVKKLLSAIANNIPGLLEEMEVGRAGQKLARRRIPNMPHDGGVLRANGPIVTRHMKMFGAKLGFAFHYEAHKTPIPIAGGVQPMYFTNVNAARGELPMDLIALLPEPKTLEQGSRTVSEQFKIFVGLNRRASPQCILCSIQSSFCDSRIYCGGPNGISGSQS